MAWMSKTGSFTREQLAAEDLGGCDALLIASILFHPDKSRPDVKWLSKSGVTNKPITTDTLFAALHDLIAHTEGRTDLGPKRAEFLRRMHGEMAKVLQPEV